MTKRLYGRDTHREAGGWERGTASGTAGCRRRPGGTRLHFKTPQGGGPSPYPPRREQGPRGSWVPQKRIDHQGHSPRKSWRFVRQPIPTRPPAHPPPRGGSDAVNSSLGGTLRRGDGGGHRPPAGAAWWSRRGDGRRPRARPGRDWGA